MVNFSEFGNPLGVFKHQAIEGTANELRLSDHNRKICHMISMLEAGSKHGTAPT